MTDSEDSYERSTHLESESASEETSWRALFVKVLWRELPYFIMLSLAIVVSCVCGIGLVTAVYSLFVQGTELDTESLDSLSTEGVSPPPTPDMRPWAEHAAHSMHRMRCEVEELAHALTTKGPSEDSADRERLDRLLSEVLRRNEHLDFERLHEFQHFRHARERMGREYARYVASVGQMSACLVISAGVWFVYLLTSMGR